MSPPDDSEDRSARPPETLLLADVGNSRITLAAVVAHGGTPGGGLRNHKRLCTHRAAHLP